MHSFKGNKSRMYLVNFRRIQLPTYMGGLGICNTYIMNKVLLFMWV